MKIHENPRKSHIFPYPVVVFPFGLCFSYMVPNVSYMFLPYLPRLGGFLQLLRDAGSPWSVSLRTSTVTCADN